jgi:hypothetical protein
MLLTLEIVLGRIRRFVDDEVAAAGTNQKWSNQELVDALTDAQDDLVNFVARRNTFAIDEDETSADLPDDLYRVVTIKTDSDGYTLRPLDTLEDVDTDEDVWEGCYWYLLDTTIEFTNELPDDVSVFYQAYYPELDVNDLNAPIYVPRWAVQACVYYVSAQLVEKQIIADPQLRRWATEIDAGKPTDNPFLAVSKYLLERYREVCYAHIGDAQERNSWPSSYP